MFTIFWNNFSSFEREFLWKRIFRIFDFFCFRYCCFVYSHFSFLSRFFSAFLRKYFRFVSEFLNLGKMCRCRNGKSDSFQRNTKYILLFQKMRIFKVDTFLWLMAQRVTIFQWLHWITTESLLASYSNPNASQLKVSRSFFILPRRAHTHTHKHEIKFTLNSWRGSFACI